MAANEDTCVHHVLAASLAESAAMDLDRAGDTAAAIAKYEESERELAAAIAVALPSHAEDHPKLVQHREEVLVRIAHLKGLSGKPPSIPLEDQIKAVQLGMRATSAASTTVSAGGGVKCLAACAAIGAGAGFLVLGSTVGTTIAVVGGAAAAGYVATRSDKVGELARGVGDLAIKGADKAMEINEKHHLTEKAVEAGKKALTAAKEADEKYGITTKIATGVSAAVAKAQEIEQKHHVTDKVAEGISKGITKVSAAFDKPAAASPAAPAAPAS